jgi:hypothetical protein
MNKTVVLILITIAALGSLGVAAVFVASDAFVGAAKDNQNRLDAAKVRINSGYHQLPAVTTMTERSAAWVPTTSTTAAHWEYSYAVAGDRTIAAESWQSAWSGDGCQVEMGDDTGATPEKHVLAYCRSLGLYLAGFVPSQGEARVVASEDRIYAGVSE